MSFLSVLRRVGFLVVLFKFIALSAPASPPPGYYLVWSDEFNGSSLDPTKWWVWNQPDRSGFSTPNAVIVSNGYLTIQTYTTNSLNYTAIVSSDGLFRARYGYTESSVEFNGSPGMFSDFWMQSPDNTGVVVGDPAVAGAEIDVCEHRATDASNVDNINGMVTIDLHWNGYTSGVEKSVNGSLVGSGLGTGFHTYGLLWNSTNYLVSIDGTNMFSTNVGVSQRSEIILLSCEVDSNSFCGIVPPGGYGNSQASTTSTVVDYVRFYAPTTTVYWLGSSSANWSDSGNWLSNMVPTSGSDVVFSYLTVGNTSITLGQSTTVNSLSIGESGPIIISGSPLTVNSGGIDMLSAINDAVIYAPLVLGGSQSWNVEPGYVLAVAAPVSGSGTVTLNGPGEVELDGTNNSSGSTTVNNGTLMIFGVQNNPVTVTAGGVLAGTGTIGSPVQINPGGTLSPGSGIGTLTISNTLTLLPGSTTSVDVNKTAGTNDEVVGLTTLNYGGTLTVNNLGGTFAPGDAFKLFNANNYSGTFGRIVPITPGTNLAWNTSTLAVDGTLRVVSTISSNITASLAGNQATLSWPANNLGWLLQTQTNVPLGAGLSFNWVTLSNSGTTNLTVINVNPAVGSAFYRLAPPTTTTALFSKGDLIVLQVGNGSIAAAGAPGFLNDYLTVGGALQTQVALPTTGSNALIFGSSSYEGLLSVSGDGQNIIVGGYNVALGSFSGTIDSSSTTGASAVPRAVGSVNVAGVFTLNAKTTQFSGSTIRSAVADGAGNFWAGGGSGGIIYLGNNSSAATISTVSASTRVLNLVNGNIYFTEASSTDGVMGFTGEPKSSTSPTLLLSTAGTGTGTPSPEGFAFNSALTIAYVADNRTAANGGGIQRFNWNGSSWVYAYTLANTLTSSDVVYAMIADFSGPNPVLYAITGETTGNHIIATTDSGPGSTFTSVEFAPSGDAFRGLIFAP